MSRLRASKLLALACGAIALTASPIYAESVADSLSEEVRTVFEHSRDAVVKIEASDKDGQLRGTGFFIDPDGTLLTSYSVGGESGEIVVVCGNMKFPARRLVTDARSGIALLKVENGGCPTAFLPMASSTGVAVSVATPVVSVAYPMDMPLTPNFGMVAGFNLKYLDRYFVTTHIRANVPVQRGEGGAPLLNMRGEVVGMVISGLDNGSACFALPIEAAEKIHRDYIHFGAVRPGRLGIVLKEASVAHQNSTAEVDFLEPGSPAAAAGIEKGDFVTKVGNTAISSWQDVQNAAFYLTAGESVMVTVWRGDKQLTIPVEPAERTPVAVQENRFNRGSSSALVDITLRVP